MNNSILFEILVEQNILKTAQTKPLVDAIKSKRKITFDYYGPRKPKKDSVRPGRRIKAEPYAIGLSKKGNLIIRMWIEPPSVSKKGFQKTNWRTFMVTRMRNITILDETFIGDKPGYKTGNDNSMTVTYVSLDKSTQPTPVKQKQPIQKKPEIKKPEKLQPITKPITNEPKKLPQPKPEKKPEELTKEPEVEKTQDTVSKEKELPQPKPEEKPTEDGNLDKNINEELKRMKTLMFS